MQRVWCVRRLIKGGLNVLRSSTHHKRYTTPVNSFCTRQFRKTTVKMSYEIVEKGRPNTLEYRMFFSNASGNIISPFHDIPLYADQEKKIYNMVVEIPRWTNHKMEVNKEEKLNPIKQDVKKGNLRFVKNVFPHHGYIWNYGAFPQTWEDPHYTEPETGTKGDNDPLDVCEIGYKVHKRGAVVQVKILGTMCLIDEGETDWKIICIDVTDPLAKDLNDINDVEKQMPGFLKATNEWFRIYKMPDGKPENTFAFNGEAKDMKFATNVVEECHKQWQGLIGQKVDNCGICCENTSVAGSPYLIEKDDAKKVIENQTAKGDAAPLPDDVDMWHYVKL